MGPRRLVLIAVAVACWCGCGEQGADGSPPSMRPSVEACSASTEAPRIIGLRATNASTFVALADDGAVFCWGDNSAGQCDPESIYVSLAQPVRATYLPCAVQAACDVVGVAVDASGYVYTWGPETGNLRGAGVTILDDLTLIGSDAVSADVSGGAAGYVTRSGTVMQWGSVDGEAVTTPRRRELPFRAESLGVSDAFACAVSDAGELWCWGRNRWGELGLAGAVRDPVRVELPHPVTQVAVDDQFACAVAAGDAVCWGRNNIGQTGAGVLSETMSPTRVGIDAEVAGVATGNAAACAWTTSGEVYCWGYNFNWRLGPEGFESEVVRRVDELVGATEVAIGEYEICAVVDGTIRCRVPNSTGREFVERTVSP